MVKALKAGKKTQTRRIIKVQPPNEYYRISTLLSTTGDRRNEGRHFWGRYAAIGNSLLERTEGYFPCPYGSPGDRLWVRENSYDFGYWGGYMDISDEWVSEWCSLAAAVPRHFAADGPCPAIDIAPFVKLDSRATAAKWRSTPSIHLRRADCRLLLEIVDVRCERLTDISEEDAKAEGVNIVNVNKRGGEEWENYLDDWAFEYFAKDSYATLWEKINGLGSWAANPWVWVVEFKVIEPTPAASPTLEKGTASRE
jgi:hypothetical protein